MSPSRSLVALGTCLSFLLPATAFAADKSGRVGNVRTVEVNTRSADTYVQYHGRITVGKDEYRWGGSSCGTRVINDDQVALLLEALRASQKLRVRPRYQDGQGSTRCLVGFTVERQPKKKK